MACRGRGAAAASRHGWCRWPTTATAASRAGRASWRAAGSTTSPISRRWRARRRGARPVATARVPVVMHPDVAESWIAEMHEAFSGEMVLKKASWLTEALGSAIAAPCVTLVDDGRLRRGSGTEPYDGEGVATRRN